MRTISITIQFLFCLFLTSNCFAQIAENFTDEIVDADFTRPVGITFDDNGIGYVWEQRGTVYLIDQNGEKIPLIDLSEEVGNWGDHGLVGFTLHPDYLANGYFYLLYVVDRHHLMTFDTPDYNAEVSIPNQATIGRITRYQVEFVNELPQLIPDSRTILLGETKETGFPILMNSHGVGSLVFGEDGSLMASCGEAGSYQTHDIGSAPETYFQQALEDGILKEKENIGSFRSQLVDCLSGKIIRIDPETGDGISSNPYFDAENPRSARSRVWALGYRNPYRFIVRPNTGGHSISEGLPGHLFVGDVGSGLWEEVTLAQKGGSNAGWPLFEGFDAKWPFYWEKVENPDAINPLAENGECERDLFYFGELFQQENEAQEYHFANPCATHQQVPAEIPTFSHERPILIWSNVLWNPPTRAFTPSFDTGGHASAIRLDSSASQVIGENFDGFSSIPAFFYEGDDLPEEFHGMLFQVDYAGWIRAIRLNEANQVIEVKNLHVDCKGITHLTQNPIDGAFYYTNITDQKVHRFFYSGTPPPVVVASSDVQYGLNPLTVQFNAEQSYSPYASPLSYLWEFGDGETSTAVNPIHTYNHATDDPFSYTATVTVSDTSGLSRSKEILISVNNTPPKVNITSIGEEAYYPINGITNLSLEAEVTDDEHTQEELSYAWTAYLHHNTHYHAEETIYTPESEVLVEPFGCNDEVYWYRVELIVTDANGLVGMDSREVHPYCGDPIVSFIDLNGTTDNQLISLQWSVENENDILQYEIQKQRSINDFEVIGTVNATNNSSYQFEDGEGHWGTNTYRIKAINSAGIFTYSNEFEILLEKNDPYFVYPNPAGTNFTIGVKDPANMIQLDLFDNIGRLIFSYQWDSSPNVRFLQTLSTSAMTNGVYFYQIKSGEASYKGKLSILK